MCPFSSGASAGPSAGAAMLPYCLAPAATGAMFPAEPAAGSSTRARSSSVIFIAGLSSVLAIISFFTYLVVCFLRRSVLLWRGLRLASSARRLAQAIRTCDAWIENFRMLHCELFDLLNDLLIFFQSVKERSPSPIQE